MCAKDHAREMSRNVLRTACALAFRDAAPGFPDGNWREGCNGSFGCACESGFTRQIATHWRLSVPTFRVMTYNAHSCVGTDGTLSPGRIAEVIARANADVVALQELDTGQSRSASVHQPEWLAEQLGMFVHFTPARRCNEGHYGNALLTRHPFTVLSEGGLQRRYDEERAVQWLKIHIAGLEVSVLNTHLSVRFRDRLLQIEELLGTEWLAQAESHVPLVLCGDLNSSRFSPVYRRLAKDMVDAQCTNGKRALPTWPSRWPLFRIDHLFTSRSIRVIRCGVLRDSLSMLASDHLPLVAELSCTGLE
jgi:endonuclease/exonuclease/phosphatase family metal-dependent hydrolase